MMEFLALIIFLSISYMIALRVFSAAKCGQMQLFSEIIGKSGMFVEKNC